MMALVDTHALLWLLDGNERLGEKSRILTQQSAQDDSLYVSGITPWEIAMLVSKGRLVLVQEIGEWLRIAVSMPGVRMAPFSTDVSVASTRLPEAFHCDPADRIIVATARHLGAILVTEDKLILEYGKAGHVKCHRAGV